METMDVLPAAIIDHQYQLYGFQVLNTFLILDKLLLLFLFGSEGMHRLSVQVYLQWLHVWLTGCKALLGSMPTSSQTDYDIFSSPVLTRALCDLAHIVYSYIISMCVEFRLWEADLSFKSWCDIAIGSVGICGLGRGLKDVIWHDTRTQRWSWLHAFNTQYVCVFYCGAGVGGFCVVLSWAVVANSPT